VFGRGPPRRRSCPRRRSGLPEGPPEELLWAEAARTPLHRSRIACKTFCTLIRSCISETSRAPVSCMANRWAGRSSIWTVCRPRSDACPTAGGLATPSRSCRGAAGGTAGDREGSPLASPPAGPTGDVAMPRCCARCEIVSPTARRQRATASGSGERASYAWSRSRTCWSSVRQSACTRAIDSASAAAVPPCILAPSPLGSKDPSCAIRPVSYLPAQASGFAGGQSDREEILPHFISHCD
jgi:hypothetical protein